MSTRKPGMLRSEKCSELLRMIEKKQRNTIMAYDMLLVCTRNLFVGHMPIEISSLCFHFISQDPGNNIKALITGKRQWGIGLVVPAKLIFITNNKRFSEVLENELIKRKNKFPMVTLKFEKKGVYRKFPFYLK